MTPMNFPCPLTLTVNVERWPILGSFAISRGAKTEAVVVVAELGDGKAVGRGECVPYARYGESVENVTAAIEAMRAALAAGLSREALQMAMPPGAARNALDCAFWDLAAKQSGQPAYALAGLPPPHALVTALTISLASPADMAGGRRQGRPPRAAQGQARRRRRQRAHRRRPRRGARARP